MTISVQDLTTAIQTKNGFPLDPPQMQAVQYGTGPLWLIAGPGTGKTEVIVVRCLKLLCCDGVNPGSIMVTTFTEKAARSLEDRIADAMSYVATLYPSLQCIDLSQLRIGTLHSLCNEVLQEFRYSGYLNLRLLDDIGSQMLIRDRVAPTVRSGQTYLARQFHYLFGNKPRPNLWDWTKVLQMLLNRVIEDQVDITALRLAGGAWVELAEANDLYEQELAQRYMCDFARLQQHFLDFLRSAQGRLFLDGDGTPQHPPLLHILVDEYQDTNLIQEQIYFTLAGNAPHNLTVVGDDDQALYRFRGGTVECMIGFGDRCAQYWNVHPKPVPLVDNHRSDERIVQWCNTYITSFPHMSGARVAGKPPLNHPLGPRGPHPAVAIIREACLAGLASAFADTVTGLVAHGILQDYSQCVLLLRSAKDSPQNAGPYIAALTSRGIPCLQSAI